MFAERPEDSYHQDPLEDLMDGMSAVNQLFLRCLVDNYLRNPAGAAGDDIVSRTKGDVTDILYAQHQAVLAERRQRASHMVLKHYYPTLVELEAPQLSDSAYDRYYPGDIIDLDQLAMVN